MLLTLGEILQWDILEKARVITDTFDRGTVVENITIMEAPDIGKWIDGNNILLTGLYTIYGDRRKIAEFVESLHSGKICALFVKVQRFVDSVPEPIITACRDLGIALVEIPGHIRYIDIMYPVIASIFESRVVQLNYHKQTLSALTGLALGNRGVCSIASACAGLVENPTILYDVDMCCLYATDEAFGKATQGWNVEEGSWEDLDFTVKETRFAGHDRLYRQTLVPVRIFGQTKMYLAVVEKNRPLTKMDFVALENVVMVLCFELVKDFAEEEMESRFKQEIVEDIRQGRDLDSVKERLASLKVRAGAKFNVLLVEMPPNPISRTPAIVRQRLMDHGAGKVHDLYLSAKKKLRLAGFESYSATSVTAFIEQPDDAGQTCRKTLEALSRNFLERVRAAFPNMPLHIGYTSSFRGVSQLTELYKNAEDALHISRTLLGENTFCDYDGLGVFKLLCMVRDRGELEACIPQSILSLQAHQQESGLPLLDTLAAYFKHNANIQQAAKSLFIHYKTLYYRLGKIESIAGVDLKNSTETFELQMGLHILRVMGKREK